MYIYNICLKFVVATYSAKFKSILILLNTVVHVLKCISVSEMCSEKKLKFPTAVLVKNVIFQKQPYFKNND